MNGNSRGKDDIQSVTQVTRKVKATLEGSFSRSWVEGEIFTLKRPASGHLYFQLKDPNAQLAAVMFRSAAHRSRVNMRDGMRVQCYGRITVYEPQGRYQLVVDDVREAGNGALLAALEQLKKRLSGEGLFDGEHKQPLPFLPKTVGLVTSGTGAAVRDMVRGLHDRYPTSILLYPCRVQGQGSAQEICQGIRALDAQPDVQVIIVGRGGGSLEDLWAFNEEEVARTIFEAKTPIVSAVGHEIDVLISDFVADVRAPTPTGSAALVVPREVELREQIARGKRRLRLALEQQLRLKKNRLKMAMSRLPNPQHSLETSLAKLDEMELRLQHSIRSTLSEKKARQGTLGGRLRNLHPAERIRSTRQRVSHARMRLVRSWQGSRASDRDKLDHIRASLLALGPQQVLDRGYAIVQDEISGGLISQKKDAQVGHFVSVRLRDGGIRAQVVAGKPEK